MTSRFRAALLLLAVAGARPAAAAAPAAKSPMSGLSDASEVLVTADCGPDGTADHLRYGCPDGRSAQVEITLGDLHIWADAVDFYQQKKTETTPGSHRVEAQGNVVFMRGEERISGNTLKMDLDTGKGTLTNARGYVQPGVFFEADTVERLAATTYRVKGARFTSCFQPNPRWGFTAARATIKIDDHVLATAVNFKVLGVPTPIWLPIFYYPIQQDQRATGLLAPQIGKSNSYGWMLGTGFFWAMSRSVDQTVQYEYASDPKFGYQRLTHELRYLRQSPSGGGFNSSYYLAKNGTRQYALNWNASQILPEKLRATLAVSQTSSTLIRQANLEDFIQATNRSRFTSFALQRSFGRNSVQVLTDQRDYNFGLGTANESEQRQEHLPSVTVSRAPQKLGRTGILIGYRASGEFLGLGDENSVDHYSRFDFAPQVSRPLSTSFLQLTPRFTAHYNRYGAVERPDNIDTPDIDEGGFFRDPVDRRFIETSLEMRGPKVFRVFNNPFGLYTDKIKHQIEPEATWQYRSRVDYGPDSTGAQVPKLDGLDFLVQTSQFTYGLNQTFTAKRPGTGGKLVPYNFLTWRVFQTYYAQAQASRFDPALGHSPYDIGAEPESFSPVVSNVRLRPTTRFSTNFNTEYDVKRSSLRTIALSGTIDYTRLGVNGTWSRFVDPTNTSRVSFNTIQGRTRLELIPGKIHLEGEGVFDLNRKESKVLSRIFSVRYDMQCCGIMVQRRDVDYGGLPEHRWTFQFQLANIGSVGTMGDANGQGGFGGR
jgi:LPS-assembly protein